MLARLNADDAPVAVVVASRPTDPLHYGRIVAEPDGTILRMVEYKDANEEERAVNLCNSGPDGGAAPRICWPLLVGRRERQCGERILSARHRHARRRRSAAARR